MAIATYEKPDKTIWVCPHCGQWNGIDNDKTCYRCGTLQIKEVA